MEHTIGSIVNIDTMNKSKVIHIGQVGVDSGQLVLCDPAYIESQYKTIPSSGADHAHDVYEHADGSLWQYTHGDPSNIKGVTNFPGTYGDVVPRYGKTPNEMIESKELKKRSDINPVQHIPEGEFSYRGICQATSRNDSQGGQLNFTLGHAGAAVAFRTGLGDGVYDVFAELVDAGIWGERVKKVWVELISDEELEELRGSKQEEN